MILANNRADLRSDSETSIAVLKHLPITNLGRTYYLVLKEKKREREFILFTRILYET